jgi:hypothetical protein
LELALNISGIQEFHALFFDKCLRKLHKDGAKEAVLFEAEIYLNKHDYNSKKREGIFMVFAMDWRENSLLYFDSTEEHDCEDEENNDLWVGYDYD